MRATVREASEGRKKGLDDEKLAFDSVAHTHLVVALHVGEHVKDDAALNGGVNVVSLSVSSGLKRGLR